MPLINDPEEYFGRLVGRLEACANAYLAGEAAAPVRDDAADPIGEPIAEAVDFQLRSDFLEPFQTLDAPKLKQLCLQVYNTDDVDALRAEIPPSLAPEWIDLFSIIAYTRCHIATLEYLVSTYPASVHPSFDRLASFNRYRAVDYKPLAFHDGPTRFALIRMWVALLRSNNGWAHLREPAPGSAEAAADPDRAWRLGNAVMSLLAKWTPQDEALRSTPEVANLLAALADMGIRPDASILAQLLTTLDGSNHNFETGRAFLCGLPTATMLVENYWPARGFKGRNAIAILMPLAMVDAASDPDRLQVMRMVPDHGCYVNSRTWPDQYGEFMPFSRYREGTVLCIAAERGDMELVELLLEFGAQGDMGGHGRKFPSEIARENRHVAVAERIESETERLRRRG